MATDSFAIYRLPHQKECTLVAPQPPKGGVPEIATDAPPLGGWGACAFVIAPFAIDDSMPLIIVRADDVRTFDEAKSVPCDLQETINKCCCDNITPDDDADVSGRDEYAKDFKLFHSRLESGEFSKIVLARHTVVETSLSPFEMFHKACERYPRMFIALFSTPDSGTWLMATPEVLLEKQGEKWHTMALAGTMKLDGNALLFDEPIGNRQPIMWGEKNIQEQRYVATYINEQIRPFASDIVEDGPRTVRAGNLVHLRSDFLFTMQTDDIGNLIEALHPTPAVCGLPKDKTRDFIIANEHTPRKYYSGFAGPVGINGATHLYVSLRCMRIRNRQCDLYAGGGLLRDSNEQSEWEETEAKMMTMKAIINGF